MKKYQYVNNADWRFESDEMLPHNFQLLCLNDSYNGLNKLFDDPDDVVAIHDVMHSFSKRA